MRARIRKFIPFIHATSDRVWKFARRFTGDFARMHLPGLHFFLKIRLLNRYSKDSGLLILVYTMAKVGSRTIRQSLINYGIPAFQIHSLTNKQGVPFWGVRYLQKNLDYRRWKIVSLVRDPVAKNVSAFFTRIHKTTSLASYVRQYKSLTLENLRDIFLENFNHDIPSDWIDQELKKVFRFDVYSIEFPKTQGYKIYK
ncbi:MAG: putative capsular polysaccharide synthesis family protein, partial [Candidatus Hodarchaeota archaeon]